MPQISAARASQAADLAPAGSTQSQAPTPVTSPVRGRSRRRAALPEQRRVSQRGPAHKQRRSTVSQPLTLPKKRPSSLAESAAAPQRCSYISSTAGADAGDSSFRIKAHNFWTLLKDRPAYRRTMLAAWAHTAGNGMLNASYMALLASVGGNSPSRSFLAIAIKDLGQTAVFSAVNIFGSHRLDSARPTDDAHEDARRRRGFLRELRSMCLADAAIAAGLVAVGFAACPAGITAPLLLTGALVGLRLCLACKAVYEMSLFPCVRQLLGQQTLGDMITPADRMIPSLEGTVSMMTNEAVSCTVQFIIFAQGSGLVVPCAMGVAIGGALFSAVPKWLLYAADTHDALIPSPQASKQE